MNRNTLIGKYLLLIVLVTMGIVIGVNEAYKTGKGYITLWQPADALAFYGAYLSFLGTVVLGALAVYQNKKAQDLNEQLQKLQEAQYISMVTATKVRLGIESYSVLCSANNKTPEFNVIDLTLDGFETEKYYYIDVEFKNDSKYPIVQMEVHPGKRGNANYYRYGMKKDIDRAVYIGKDSSGCYRYIVPCKCLEKRERNNLHLSISFVNIFDYVTQASLYISDLQNNSNKNEYQYRLSKFTDIRPSNS